MDRLGDPSRSTSGLPWGEVQRLLDGALDLAPESRAAYIAQASGGDNALHDQVVRLLNACQRAERTGGLLALSAGEVAGPMLADLARLDAELRHARIESLRTTLSDRYTIERIIAEGDLASVVLARDLRHDRLVAIKVLARELVTESGVGRFLREIHLTARLSHPHVLPLHDSGEASGLLYYVMPYAEGETLRARLVREGALPLPDVIRLFRELADALGYAHASGVVHRDLKPENVLLSGGHAVIADFGIAEALAAAQGDAPPAAARDQGDIALGTPAYMAPEQRAGLAVDHRADLYALGVVGYEMLTGSRPFDSRVPGGVKAAHQTEPLALGSEVPAPLAELVLQCLAAEPGRRPASAAVVISALDALPRGRRPSGHPLARVIGWGGLTALAAGVLLTRRGPPSVEFGPVNSMTRDPGLEMHPALSPDGARLAYAAGPIGAMKVYVRETDSGAPVLLAPGETRNQTFPAWSPDGSRVLFRVGCRFYLVPASGGVPEEMRPEKECPASYTAAAWSPDGKSIAYVDADTLVVAPVAGGTPRRLGTVREGHSPAWSPDGRWIAVVSGNWWFARPSSDLGNMAPSALALFPAAGGAPTFLTNRRAFDTSPVWLPDSRHLLFMSTRGGGRDLYLLRLNAGGHPAGSPTRLTTGLDVATFSISHDGRTLAYTAFENISNVWAVDIPDRGVVTAASARQVTRGTDYVEGISVSSDRKWLAFDSDRAGNSDLYVMPIEGGEARRVTTDPGFEFDPAFSSDGKRLAYHSSRNDSRDVFVIGVDGTGDQLVAGGPARESAPTWGPDGRRLAFFSDRTGRSELFVSEQDESGSWAPPRQLTREGGNIADWSPDGSRILYVCPNGPYCLIAPDGSGNHRLISLDQFPGKRPLGLNARWAPDGRTVYALVLGDSGLWRFWALPATGGTPRLVVRFDDPERQPGRAQFATDGRTLYFTMRRRESDIKAMEIRMTR